MKEKLKTKENGITLIALVITIIVLLILAAVTIAALAGENGILRNAAKAKDEQVNSTIKDAIILAWNEYQMELKLSTGKNINNRVEVASTEKVQIQSQLKNSLISTSMNFLDYLREEKKVIDENGVINVEALIGQKAHRGNGTDGLTDVYKIEIDEENKTYTLKYYGKASEETELLYSIEDENIQEASEIVEPENSDEWEYDVKDGYAILTKYKGDAEVLVVPNYIEGIPVKQVGDGTNPIWDENNTECVGMYLVDTISGEFFQTKISEIRISKGIEIIGDSCFYKIANLNYVEIPSTVTSIGNYAFNSYPTIYGVNASNMTLKIPKTVINLGSRIAGAGATIEVEFKNESEIPDTWEEDWNDSSSYGYENTEVTVIWAQ